MKIKTLIIMGLGVCLSLIVLLGGIGIYQLNTSINKCKQVINVDSRVVEYSQRLRADFNIMRRFEKDIFINISDQAKVGEYRIKWNGAYEKSKLRLGVCRTYRLHKKMASKFSF